MFNKRLKLLIENREAGDNWKLFTRLHSDVGVELKRLRGDMHANRDLYTQNEITAIMHKISRLRMLRATINYLVTYC